MIKKTFKTLCLTAIAILAMSSCAGTKTIAYFQDVAQSDTILQTAVVQALKVQPGDKLMIVVHSRDPQLAALYNLPVTGTRVGMTSPSNSSQASMSYTVDSNGYIDFPVLGKVKVAGMKRDDVAATIQDRLISGNLCNDAVVIVEMENTYVNVLGEVNRPGRYALTKDNMTVLDAIGLAGDLAIQGKRENVMLVRNEDGQAKTYQLDLNNLGKVVTSPAYYIQQGDVVYVEPNNYRKRQTTVNGNNALSTSFWISVGSLLTSVAVLIKK